MPQNVQRFVHRQAVFNLEVSDPGPSERMEECSVAKGFPEVSGESADVCALAASDSYLRLNEVVAADVSHVDAAVAILTVCSGYILLRGAFPLY